MKQPCKLIKLKSAYILVAKLSARKGELVYFTEKGIPLVGKIRRESPTLIDCGDVVYRVYNYQKILASHEQIGWSEHTEGVFLELSNDELENIIKSKYGSCSIEMEECFLFQDADDDNAPTRWRPKLFQGNVIISW